MVVPASTMAAPLQYLSGAGPKATPVVWLTWGLLAISIAVIGIISVLLIGALWHRPGQTWVQGEQLAVLSHAGGLNWLWIGVGLSALVLLFSMIWTVKVLADIIAPPQKPAATIEITGHQWWWEVRYLDDNPARQFTTANEIHIPTGRPVRLKLISSDVIHSFWVPQLAGKMDAIPGQTNETWIEAGKAGTYRGQCTEYCGLEHARMGIVVVAQPPAQFRKWRAHQLAAPPQPTGAALAGRQQFQMHCAGCHMVRGTEAAGAQGPDLSHLMTRQTIASGTLPNNEQSLAHWIADPQGLKPGAFMPAPGLPPAQLRDVVSYLRTLT
jgi:cytochrome c oxidase subunit 2